MKNTLATVIAITSQSLRNAETLEKGRSAVESRLVALGRAHDLLLEANWASAKLNDVIHAAIEPFDSHDVRRFVVQDTQIEVGAGAVLPLTMSLNELCTNAVKYGALSNSTGRIEIAAAVEEKTPRFRLTWIEKGGPAVQEPTGAVSGHASSIASPSSFMVKRGCDMSSRALCMNSTLLWPPCSRSARFEIPRSAGWLPLSKKDDRLGHQSAAKTCRATWGGAMNKLVVAIALTVLAGIAGAQAQTFPSRPITLVVPFPPGGSTDAIARIMAERMRTSLGQPVIIENVGGAGGSIGVGRVARAAPDGYTIDIGQWDTHVGSIIYNLTYDLQTDFEPIGLMSVNPQLMVAKKALPADDLKGLVAWMKANPGKINFVNQNAAAQVTGILFEQATGQKIQFIPYRGAGPAMTDLVSGQVDLLVVQAAVALPQVQAGAIKAIANLSPRRSAVVANIPTSDESGVPGLYMSGWFGFFAPKGTPKDIVTKLNAAMTEALADPAVAKRYADLGLDVASREQQTPDGLAAFQKAEIEKWWPIIRAAGIGPQAQ